jgi:hypothetical protein
VEVLPVPPFWLAIAIIFMSPLAFSDSNVAPTSYSNKLMACCQDVYLSELLNG